MIFFWVIILLNWLIKVFLFFKSEDILQDFDPDEFDKKMKASFSDEYYNKEDSIMPDGSDNCKFKFHSCYK